MLWLFGNAVIWHSQSAPQSTAINKRTKVHYRPNILYFSHTIYFCPSYDTTSNKGIEYLYTMRRMSDLKCINDHFLSADIPSLVKPVFNGTSSKRIFSVAGKIR